MPPELRTKLKVRPVYIALLLLACVGIARGQSVVSGYVFDQDARTPIAFANVVVPGTNRGAATDTLGFFRFERAATGDSLRISNLGYRPVNLPIAGLPDTIFLQPVAAELGVFEVLPGENPAFAVLDRVVAAKATNQVAESLDMRYEEYQKIRFDLNHFTDKIKRNILLRPFDYLWENEGVDSNGVRYLPALLVEKYLNHYRSQGDRKSIVEGEKITGLAGPRLMGFASDLYIVPEIYNNFIPIFEKNFPSPIHDNYQRYYRYYLMDSLPVNDRKTYLISYKPKFSSQRAFSGLMKVDSVSAAVVDISLRFDLQANVNFVRSYLIRQTYNLLQEEYWVVDSSGVLGDFTIVENASDLTGFFGRKVSVFDRYAIDTEMDRRMLNGALEEVVADSADKRSEAYWFEKRKTALNAGDQSIEAVSERLRKDPRFIFRKNLLLSIGTGYVPAGPVEIGDVYRFYSYNQVEFGRVRIGARIREKDNRPFQLEGYGAYGFRDQRWKFGLSGYYRQDLGKYSKLWIGGEVKNDIEQLGRSFNLIRIDQVFTSLRQFPDDDSRHYMRRLKGFVAAQPALGFTVLADYRNEQYETIFLSRKNDGVTTQDRFTSGSLGLTLKWSWLNRDMDPFFESRGALQKRYSAVPDIGLQLRYASEQLGSDAAYEQARAYLQQFVPVGNLGYTFYRLEGAKTWGEMPYVFAAVPYANQSLFNDILAMNLMNFMEFYADEFVQLHLAHHFDGWLLDRVPLIKKLKLRSFLFGKALVGGANQANPYLNDLPLRTAILAQPYYEWGFGLENILKFARVDFVWRYTDNVSRQENFWFIVKPSFQFRF